jgi:hypothetical protein
MSLTIIPPPDSIINQRNSHYSSPHRYKQGFLTLLPSALSIFGRRARSWYRLYGQKLYVAKPGPESVDWEMILPIHGASVSAVVESDSPHLFRITPAAAAAAASTSSYYELQADNDDELYQWLTALRRWSRSGTNTSTATSATNGTTSDLTEAPTIDNNPEWNAFMADNFTCAECGQAEPSWLSLNIGVTLCDDCRRGHQALTWAISKLKSTSLDTLTPWHIALLHSHLGNERVNRVYAASVPAGWSQPRPDSPVEVKHDWIMAKYVPPLSLSWGLIITPNTPIRGVMRTPLSLSPSFYRCMTGMSLTIPSLFLFSPFNFYSSMPCVPLTH